MNQQKLVAFKAHEFCQNPWIVFKDSNLNQDDKKSLNTFLTGIITYATHIGLDPWATTFSSSLYNILTTSDQTEQTFCAVYNFLRDTKQLDYIIKKLTHIKKVIDKKEIDFSRHEQGDVLTQYTVLGEELTKAGFYYFKEGNDDDPFNVIEPLGEKDDGSYDFQIQPIYYHPFPLVHTALGQDALKMSYLIGQGSVTATHIAMFHTFFQATEETSPGNVNLLEMNESIKRVTKNIKTYTEEETILLNKMLNFFSNKC